MPTTRRRLSPLASSLALALCTWAAPGVRADPIKYVSMGQVFSAPPGTGDHIDPFTRFRGVTDGSFDGSSPFALGRFQVAPIPPGTSRSYADAPFSISVQFSGHD